MRTTSAGNPRDASRGSLTRRALVLTALAASMPALVGCGSDPPPPATRADIKVQAAPTLNPDLNGRPSPVVVRFYQLLSSEMFENADFFQLFEQDTAALGPTSVGKDEFVIEPGQITTITLPIKKDVATLGVVVAYRDFESATWRATAAIKQDRINELNLSALGKIVKMSVGRAYVPDA